MPSDPAASLKNSSLSKLLGWKNLHNNHYVWERIGYIPLILPSMFLETFLEIFFFLCKGKNNFFLFSVFRFFEVPNREAGCKVSDSHLNWSWAKTTPCFQTLLWIISIHWKALDICWPKAGFGQQTWKVAYSTVRFCQLSRLNKLEIRPNFLNCLWIEVKMHRNITHV